MHLQTGIEFTRGVRKRLQNMGYTHIIHNQPKLLKPGETCIHWIEPLKKEDPRHSFEEAEMFIQKIDHDDVIEMANGIIGIVFKIRMN